MDSYADAFRGLRRNLFVIYTDIGAGVTAWTYNSIRFDVEVQAVVVAL